jgi:Primase X
MNKIQKIKRSRMYKKYFHYDCNTMPWIEKLLQTPIEDYRKNAVSLIIVPYLIKVKKVSSEEAFTIIKSWLDKCATLRGLDFNLDHRIKSAISDAI